MEIIAVAFLLIYFSVKLYIKKIKKYYEIQIQAINNIISEYETEIDQKNTKHSEDIKKAELFGRIKERFTMLEDITDKQQEVLNFMSHIDDEIYRELLIEELGILESSKRKILRSILDDGFDLKVAVIKDGEVLKLKISEILSSENLNKTAKPNPPLNNGLKLIKGGKDESKTGNK